MIDIVLIAISAVTSLGAVWVVSRTRRGWYVDGAPALDLLVPTDEQLQREREAYILLRTTWKPAPGSPLDWSLGLLQDECQKKIEARKRPPAPTGTSATSRGRPRDEWHDWGSSTTLDPRLVPDAHEKLREIERLYRAGALSFWQTLREIRKVQIDDQEAIKQLRADTQYLRALRAGTNQLPPPPTTGQWEPPDWAQTENVI